MRKALVLVDIDGTLLSPGLTPRLALAQAIYEYTSLKIDFQVKDLAGNTDINIVKNALRHLGFESDGEDKTVKAILERYITLLEEKYPAAEDKKVFPGSIALLDYLKRKNVRLGLITGNVRNGAFIKLKPFDLWPYFDFGVFGDDSQDRNNLPQIALRKVKNLFDEEYLPCQVVIIGDTIHDLFSAKKNGMVSVIVLRREEWREEIEANKPDLILSSFDPLEPFIEWFERYFVIGDREKANCLS